MRYPIEQPSSIPGSGSTFYLYLLQNIAVPSRLLHFLWFEGQTKLLEDPEHPFRGYYPVGETYKINSEKGVINHTFTGKEQKPIYVKDLPTETKFKLGISDSAKPAEKVWNPNYVPYEKLPQETRMSNEITTLSLAKSISSYLGSENIQYTEKDIVKMLVIAVKDFSSTEMKSILHGNHISWCISKFLNNGIIEEDVKHEFYGQNDIEFYIRDINTIMPAILYSLAILGTDPITMVDYLDHDLYGIVQVAEVLQKEMKIYLKRKIA